METEYVNLIDAGTVTFLALFVGVPVVMGIALEIIVRIKK